MTSKREVDKLLKLYDDARHELKIFMDGVVRFIGEHPALCAPEHCIVHSFKSRLKDSEHLRQKIGRKNAAGRNIKSENLFTEVTDLAGVRILHLFQDGFGEIDKIIRSKILEG
jgi:putative GTP pyrophosphokinase